MLLTRAAKEALRARTKLGTATSDSLNVFDAAIQLGFEVRFVDLPSVEGMYVRSEPPVIILSSLRPIARQVYTCAHEIGHHFLRHGETVDGLFESRSALELKDPKEREADTFAGFLLMPPSAVDHAFHVRGISYKALEHLGVYKVANYFQVGYATIIRHLQYSLSRIPRGKAEELLRFSPTQVRAEELGQTWQGNLFFIDKFWNPRSPLDCQVGDAIVVPTDSIAESGALRPTSSNRIRGLLEAVHAGIGKIQIPQGPRVTVRVAQKQYSGRLEYRAEPATDAAD